MTGDLPGKSFAGGFFGCFGVAAAFVAVAVVGLFLAIGLSMCAGPDQASLDGSPVSGPQSPPATNDLVGVCSDVISRLGPRSPAFEDEAYEVGQTVKVTQEKPRKRIVCPTTHGTVTVQINCGHDAQCYVPVAAELRGKPVALPSP